MGDAQLRPAPQGPRQQARRPTSSSARTAASSTWSALLKALREVKFKGHLSIEYEANPEEPTEDVAACVEVFKESVKKLA